jgi:hypothetical protein
MADLDATIRRIERVLSGPGHYLLSDTARASETLRLVALKRERTARWLDGMRMR